MAKEEETSTCTSSLTRLEDLVTIGARIKRLGDMFEVDIVHGAHTLENARPKCRDLGTRQGDPALAAQLLCRYG